MSRVSQAISRIEKDITGKKILEVACGCAEFSICASKRASAVHCIDLDDHRLKPEIQACENVLFQKMDATDMDYPDQAFDTIVMYNAVAHLDAVIEPILKECRRVLRPGGSIYVVSSFKIDYHVITNQLIPSLERQGIPFEEDSDAVFAYIKF